MAKSIQISRRYVDTNRELSSYRLYVAAVNAQEMTNKVFIKQRIVNFSKGTTDDVFAGVCTPSQLEDLGEDAPLAGTSFFRSNSVDLIATTSEELKNLLDSVVYEVKKLVDDLSALDLLTDDEIYNIEPNAPVTVLANSPRITSVSQLANSLLVYFSAPDNAMPTDIDNYEYSLNGGSIWALASPAVGYSPMTIVNVAYNTAYTIKIRAVTNGLRGKSSNSFSYTTSRGVIGTRFTGSINSEWTDIRNWVDSSSIAANSLPIGSTSVIVQNDCVVDVDSPLWVTPQNINIGENNLTFNSNAEIRPVVTCNITATTGTITFNGVDYGIQPVRVGAIFRGNIDTNWFNISNWLTNERVPATQLPGSTANVTLEHSCVVNVDDPNWVQPANISIGAYDITFNSTQTVNPSITCDIFATSGTAIFNGVNYGA